MDYKTLFMGAIALVVVLAGLWNRGLEQDADAIRATNTKQWERLAEFNDKLLGYGARVERLEQDRLDQEARLRAIEREHRHK